MLVKKQKKIFEKNHVRSNQSIMQNYHHPQSHDKMSPNCCYATELLITSHYMSLLHIQSKVKIDTHSSVECPAEPIPVQVRYPQM